MHSVEHNTADLTAATAGVAEMHLESRDMPNYQAEAVWDTVPVAVVKPSHIPASLPGTLQQGCMHTGTACARLPHVYTRACLYVVIATVCSRDSHNSKLHACLQLIL